MNRQESMLVEKFLDLICTEAEAGQITGKTKGYLRVRRHHQKGDNITPYPYFFKVGSAPVYLKSDLLRYKKDINQN